MFTAFLIVALIIAVLLSASVVCWSIGQGFWFWLFVGGDVCKACVYGIGMLVMAIFDSNS